MANFGDIPKQDWGNLRLHPSFKEQIKVTAARRRVSAEQCLHEILVRELGDPEPAARPRKQPTHTS